MAEYKVVAGKYTIDGGEVSIENKQGQSSLQRILDYYGAEGYRLAHTQFDNINREVVVLLERGVAPSAAPPAAPPAGDAAASEAAAGSPPTPSAGEVQATERSTGRSAGRRSQAELDRLYRDS